MDPNLLKCNVMLLGGETSLREEIMQELSDTKPTFVSTVGITEIYKIVTVNDQQVKLCVWNSAGQDRFKTLPNNLFKNMNVSVLVYDSSRKESIYELETLIEEIKGKACEETIIFVVGNQTEEREEISQIEGEQFAFERGVVPFRIISRLHQGINELLVLIAELYIKQRNKYQEMQTALNEYKRKRKKEKCSRQ